MRSIVIVVWLMLTPGGASAQSLPDYPSFSLSGQIGGNSNISTFNSDSGGMLQARANTFGSFHMLTLKSNWDPNRLRFEYSCVYAFAPNLIETPTYDDGQPCPSGGGPANSNFVRAIRISLAGSEASHYILTSQCWIGFFRQNVHDTLQPVGDGQWCGRRTGGAPQEWISWIEIRLHRR